MIPSIDVSTTVDKPETLTTRPLEHLAEVLDTEHDMPTWLCSPFRMPTWLCSPFRSDPTATQAFIPGNVGRAAAKRIGSSTHHSE